MKRRKFLADMGRAAAAAAGTAAGLTASPASASTASASTASASAIDSAHSQPRVVVIRHAGLAENPRQISSRLVRELLDEAARALSGEATPADAWARWFKPRERIGIKVNCLGLPTNPVIAETMTEAIASAEVNPGVITVWDRFDRELRGAGYRLRKSGSGGKCYGTDALSNRGVSGYGPQISTSGYIGSLYSRIITDETDALVSAAVLKDHNLAGLTCTMKNFYGAIHNPNKYHDNGCDPFIADVCAHDHIRSRLRLAICDAIRPQFHGGPPVRPAWQWPYGGILLSTDTVALDRVALEILERKRSAAGMETLAAENRPVRYLASAQERGLGVSDLSGIEVISIGRPWLDI